MPIYKVNYRDFKPENIIFGKVDKAETKDPTGKPIVYFRIPITYKYEVRRPDGSVTSSISNLYIEGPREKSRGPTKKEFEKNGAMKEQYSILTKYNLEDDDHSAFVNRDPRSGKPFGTIHKLSMACAQYVYDHGSEVGINDCFDENEMLRNKFYYPMKWKLEKGMPVPGENPAGIWKLFRYGKADRTYETSFVLPIEGGKKVDWKMIEGCQIDHQPVFKIDNITIAGGKPTIKIEVASSVIYDISESTSQSMQDDTIKQAQQADPLLEARLRDQIRKLEEALASSKVSTGAGTGDVPVVPTIPTNPVPMGIPGIPAPVVSTLPKMESPAPVKTETLPLPPPLPEPVSSDPLKAMLSSGPGLVGLPGLPKVSLPDL